MPFNIAIIDYEMGNLKSIYKLLHHLNVESIITSDAKRIKEADGIILPGVGAFGDAMKNLRQKDLISVIQDIIVEKKPLFGICLGQQLLFTKSYEMGQNMGLNILEGEVVEFDLSKVKKVPQIGWNSVSFTNKDHFLIQGIPNNTYFYFVHSFYTIPKNKNEILGLTKYDEIEFCSMISKDNVIATQFHPEKSSTYGIQMYQNFINYCKK
ncbi:MAG: imidazole glycerol phosphate synthase subunit HisH [Promethearchaeota archaeon]|nr:MAG: imidazole glycerol phosphate synthase subunit HisH [Candidatus Lokiarchaeota archaeon]